MNANGQNVPQEMHSVHSRLKLLESNSSDHLLKLSKQFNQVDNLTHEISMIKDKMAKLSDSVEAAPAIRQIPKQLETLEKVIWNNIKNNLRISEQSSSWNLETDFNVYIFFFI